MQPSATPLSHAAEREKQHLAQDRRTAGDLKGFPEFEMSPQFAALVLEKASCWSERQPERAPAANGGRKGPAVRA